MLPAIVPHAALSLSPHYSYGQTIHVKGRAGILTTLKLELSARAKPLEAAGTVLTSYKEGLQDADPRIRAIHIDRIVRIISSEKAVKCQAHRESHVSKIVEILRKRRNFKSLCRVCEPLGFLLQFGIDCWIMHDLTY